MTANILLETILGVIPLLGDLFDFAWQANTRNLALIHRHHRPGSPPRSLGWIWAAVAIIAVLMIALVVGLGYLAVKAILVAIHR
jgi:hypothetical protein